MQPQYPQAPPAPPPVDLLIHGQLTGLEPRNGGWHRFLILVPGNQYPTKVDTKKPELIQQCMALMGQLVSAEIREQESTNINPHTNRPYMNRYLNAIAPQGMLASSAQPMQQPQAAPQYAPPQAPQQAPPMMTTPPLQQPQQQGQPGLQGYEKDINIMRQCAAKCVSMSWESLPEDQRNSVGFVEACEVWMAYFVYGPLRFGVQAFGGSAPTDAPASQAPPYVPAGATSAQCPECGYENGQHAQGCPRDYGDVPY